MIDFCAGEKGTAGKNTGAAAGGGQSERGTTQSTIIKPHFKEIF